MEEARGHEMKKWNDLLSVSYVGPDPGLYLIFFLKKKKIVHLVEKTQREERC